MKFAEAVEKAVAGSKIRLPYFGAGFFVAFMPPTVIPSGIVNGRTLQFLSREDLERSEGLHVQGYFVGVNRRTGCWAPGYVFDADMVVSDEWEEFNEETD